MYLSFSEISAEQKRPLDCKIAKAVKAIKAGFDASKHCAAIAFSGGKDSTVLWHLIRTYFPARAVEIIYGNTGVEFPESLKFARQLGKEWGGEHFHETKLSRTKTDGLKYAAQRETLDRLIREGRVSEVLKPDGKLKSTLALERAATPAMWDDFRRRDLVWPKDTPMSFWWCVDQYGWPILGKAASKLEAHRINIDCFLRFSKSASEKESLADYYDVLRECKFSQHCCKCIKKEPSERLQKELGIDVIFKGLLAAESHSRLVNFATRGYMFKSHRAYLGDDPFYHVNPLQIWTDDDIWEYIHRFSVPYAPLYDVEWTDESGSTHKIPRNGCYPCATDVAYRDNHVRTLSYTHPAFYSAVMKKGMGGELETLCRLRGNKLAGVRSLVESGLTGIPADEYDPEFSDKLSYVCLGDEI